MDRENATCVVVRKGTVMCHHHRGVRPVVDFWSREQLEGATVLDKVVGKASAAFLTAGGADHVHGRIMSRLAADVFEEYGISYSYGRLVDKISDRTGEGLCPMESAVSDTEDINEAVEIILEKMKKMGLLQ